MKIKSMHLKNFKRFSDLTIDCIPESAKLVLLVGANGSGKSSIFDAFHWLSKESVFRGIKADILEIFRSFITPLNRSLSNIFGENEKTVIQIVQFEDDPSRQNPAKLIFQKGDSKINYDLLSHGEKQVRGALILFLRKMNMQNCIRNI